MKQRKNLTATLMVLLAIGSSQARAEPFAKGPYLGQTPPGPTPKVFAPGLICDTRPHRWESHGHFSADGNTFCFRRFGFVYIAENTVQGWTTPKRIETIPYRSWSPCLSPDANSIYFNRRHDPPKGWSLYRCMHTSGGWSLPQELAPPLRPWGAGFSVAADHRICFISGRGHFWMAPFTGNALAQATKIPVEANNLKGCHPGVAPDESFMVVADKDKPGGYGHFDLNLILRLPDGTWSKPRNLGPKVNSAYIEFGPRISPDKKYLFFNRSNGWDPRKPGVHSYIYWVELKEYLPESYR